VNHFTDVVDFYQNLQQEIKEIKYKTSIDFKIGKIILFPFRALKRMFL
jgi:hypothetical protein